VHLLLLERLVAKILKELVFLNNEKEKFHGIVAKETVLLCQQKARK